MTDDKIYNWEKGKKAYLVYGVFIGATIATTIIAIIW